MGNYTVEFMGSLPADVDATVSRGHEEYETSHGVVCGYKEFSIVARSNGGAPIGVLSGYTAYAEIYVDDLWVDVGYRKRGLGRDLLHTLEDRYRNMGFDNINCVTNQFQAAGFYKSCDFEIEFVRQNKHHPKLTKTFLIKHLHEANPRQGILEKAQARSDL